MRKSRRPGISTIAAVAIIIVVLIVGGVTFYEVGLSAAGSGKTVTVTTTSSLTGAPTTTTTTTPVTTETMRVGTTVSTPDPSDVPQWHGYLVDAPSLGLSITLSTFTGQQAAVSALLSGQIDGLQSSPAALLSLVTQGVPIIAIGVSIDAPDALMVSTTNITSMGQLATQHITVGITSLTDSSYYFPAINLSAQGYNITDVNWVIVPGASGRTAALIAGKIPVGAVDVAGWLQIQAAAPGQFHPLAYLSQLVAGFPQNLMFVTQTYFQSHQATLVKLMEALIMGHRWAQNKTNYMAYAPSIVGSTVNSTFLSESYDQLLSLGLWDTNNTWNVGIANLLANDFATYKISGITSAPNATIWADFTIYQQALNALGPYTGP